MSVVADKARFHLERAVPQLREFEETRLFSRDEIRTLVTKRSDFEHLVLAPGSDPADFLRYAEWEQSLEALRAKRARRLQVHTSTSHASRARTLGIYDRGVTRHPGCVPLWIAYLDFAARIKATKRWRKIVTRAVRMHPTSETLWVLVAKRVAVNGDMDSARSYFLRGCRFCTSGGSTVWLEYARCEMDWLAKMDAKRKKAGGEKNALAWAEIKAAEAANEDGDMIAFDEDSDEEDDDGLVLPDPDVRNTTGALVGLDKESAQKLEKSPALGGAIPMAIFDVAKKQSFFSADAAEAFFDLFARFPAVQVQDRLLQNVVDTMQELYPGDASTWSVLVRRPLVGIDSRSPEFPRALRVALTTLKRAQEQTTDKTKLAAKMSEWVQGLLGIEGLDPGIRTVLEFTAKKTET